MNTVEPIRDKKDINRMKKALDGQPRNLLLFTIGINTALRISDILPLKVRDVRQGFALITEQKTGKAKHVHFNKAVIDAAAKCVPKDAADNDWLFPSRTGSKPISRVQAYRVLNEAASRADVALTLGTHSLRKTFAYHAYKAGTDLALLQSLLNHASQRETLRYIGITADQIEEVYTSVCL